MSLRQHDFPTTLLLVSGVAGVGKSTLAREILKRYWFCYLDNNFVADAFFADTRVGSDYEALRPRLYDVLYRVTRENLALGNSVIIDAPHVTHMRREQWRDYVQQLARSSGALLLVIRCTCKEFTLRSRLVARDEKRDDWKLANWDLFKEREPIDFEVPFTHVVVDTEVELADQIEKVGAFLREAWHGA